MLSESDQKTLDSLIKQIKQSYSELKTCQLLHIKSTIVWSIKEKCNQALKLLSKSTSYSANLAKSKQLLEIKAKVEQLQKQIQEEQKNTTLGLSAYRSTIKVSYSQDINQDRGDLQQVSCPKNKQKYQNHMQVQPHKITEKGDNFKQHFSRQSIRGSRQILSCIAIQQIKSVNLKYTNEQLDQVLGRMENNLQLMKTIQEMIHDQGGKLEVVEKNIQQAYQNVKDTNTELDIAQQQQLKAIRMVRKVFQYSAFGVWGVISWPFKTLFGRS